MQLHVHSRDYCDIRRTLKSTPGLRGHIPFIECILVGVTQECEQIEKKFRYTVKSMPLTKNRWRAPFVARNNLAPVVQKVDSAIQRIYLYPVDSAIGFPNTYPLDRDLSGG